MTVNRVETVEVPAGVFRAFVVERTVTSMAPGPRPVVAYTYWYAPDAGAIVKSSVKNGSKKPLTDEADVLGIRWRGPVRHRSVAPTDRRRKQRRTQLAV